VVALNPKTGAVLAMASYPSFDPNVLAIHDGAKLNKVDNRLLKDKAQPLLNRALQGTYPPGSTFKIVTSSAPADREPQHHDPHQRRFADHPSPCRRPSTSCTTTRARRAATGAARPPLITAFAQSCDTTFAKIGIQVGANGPETTWHRTSA